VIGLLLGKMKGYLIAVGAALSALLFVYLKGKRDAEQHAHELELNEYVETRRRIDENTIPRDATAAREWLRQRKQRSDL